jgi:hypothetical protein
MQLFGQSGNALAIKQAARACKNASSHLNHDGVSGCRNFLTNEVSHRGMADFSKLF